MIIIPVTMLAIWRRYGIAVLLGATPPRHRGTGRGRRGHTPWHRGVISVWQVLQDATIGARFIGRAGHPNNTIAPVAA
jgi:hypothetical protein